MTDEDCQVGIRVEAEDRPAVENFDWHSCFSSSSSSSSPSFIVLSLDPVPSICFTQSLPTCFNQLTKQSYLISSIDFSHCRQFVKVVPEATERNQAPLSAPTNFSLLSLARSLALHRTLSVEPYSLVGTNAQWSQCPQADRLKELSLSPSLSLRCTHTQRAFRRREYTLLGGVFSPLHFSSLSLSVCLSVAFSLVVVPHLSCSASRSLC